MHAKEKKKYNNKEICMCVCDVCDVHAVCVGVRMYVHLNGVYVKKSRVELHPQTNKQSLILPVKVFCVYVYINMYQPKYK